MIAALPPTDLEAAKAFLIVFSSRTSNVDVWFQYLHFNHYYYSLVTQVSTTACKFTQSHPQHIQRNRQEDQTRTMRQIILPFTPSRLATLRGGVPVTCGVDLYTIAERLSLMQAYGSSHEYWSPYPLNRQRLVEKGNKHRHGISFSGLAMY